MNKKNVLRIVLVILACLVIIAVPLTVKLVGDSLSAPDIDNGGSDIVVPSVPDEDSGTNPPVDIPNKPEEKPETPEKDRDIVVKVSIEANRLFGEDGRQYLASVERKMGKELFAALNNGDILPSTEITVKASNTVRDVMTAVEKQLGIVISGSYTYISAIGGLAEKMASPMSGWVYTLNGQRINVGVGSCAIHDGDSIEWHYVL